MWWILNIHPDGVICWPRYIGIKNGGTLASVLNLAQIAKHFSAIIGSFSYEPPVPVKSGPHKRAMIYKTWGSLQ